jgi:hypothetical protein
MKIIVLLTLGIVVAGVLSGGCVTQAPPHTNDNGNISFTPFSVPATDNDTVTRGPLKISNGGWTGEYPVSVDNKNVGFVSASRPITLMLEEGNHSVEVCCGKICEHQVVAVAFGKQRTVDLSEQLKKDLGSSEPAVSVIGYNLNQDRITVDVEFTNPTTQARTMTADVSCGYSYIDDRTRIRLGSSARGHLYATVNACDRVTQTLDLNLDGGSSYIYDMPKVSLGS